MKNWELILISIITVLVLLSSIHLMIIVPYTYDQNELKLSQPLIPAEPSDQINDFKILYPASQEDTPVNNDFNHISTIHSTKGRTARSNTMDSWPMFKNTVDRRGISKITIPNNKDILWNTKTAPSYTSPVVAYGKVFMSTSDGQLFCLEETTGKIRWQEQVSLDKYASISTPAVSLGSVFVFNSGDGGVYKFDAYTGERGWSFTSPGKDAILNLSYIDHPLLSYDGRVMFGAPNRIFYCLNETNGKLVWSFETQEGLTRDYGITGGAAAYDEEVFFGAGDGFLYAMDLNGFSDGNQGWSLEDVGKTGAYDGDILWKYFTGDTISSTPVVFNNYVYVTVGIHNSTEGNYNVYKIYCLDRINGTLVWDLQLSDHIISSPSVTDNEVIFGGVDNRIYCVDTTSNNSIWLPITTGDAIWSSPAVANGRVVIGSNDHNLYCLRTGNGVEVWRLDLQNPISSSPALANNRIYVSTITGEVFAIGQSDTQLPRVIKSYPVNDDLNIPVSSYLTLNLSEHLDPEMVNSENIILFDKNNHVIPIVVKYNDPNLNIEIKPLEFLNLSEMYKLKISSMICDCAGNCLDGNLNNNPDGSPIDDITITFTTSSNNPPQLLNPKVSPKVGKINTEFSFTVLYLDSDNDPPGIDSMNIKIFLDNEPIGYTMILNDTEGAPEKWHDGIYTDGEEYILKVKLDRLGIHSFRIWCNDGTDWNETLVVGSPILPGPPVIKTIPDLFVKEDIEYILDLSKYIEDPDTSFENLTFRENSSFAHVNGTTIRFLYPNSFNYPSGKQYEIVNISASDSERYSATEVKLWILPVNDEPYIIPKNSQIVVEEKEFRLNLREHVFDIDTPFEELNITENSNHTYIDDDNFVFYYPGDITSEKVILTVSDGEFWVESVINVKVVSSEVSFVIMDIEDQNVIEDIEYNLDVKNYLMLIRGTIGNLKLECSSYYSEVVDLNVRFLYPDSFIKENNVNFENVKITITDTSFNHVESSTVKVKVSSINDAPQLINGSVKPTSGNISIDYTFEVYYFDIDDTENVRVHLVLDNDELLMENKNGVKDQYPGLRFSFTTKLEIGNHYFYFKCDDGSNEPNSQYTTNIRKLFVTGNLDPAFSGGGLDNGVTGNDFDQDGILDSWEEIYGLDPTNKSDALSDFDGDSFSNIEEYLGFDGLPFGDDSTNPNDPSEKPIEIVKTKQEQMLNEQHWPLLLILIGAILLISTIGYVLFSSRGVSKTARIPKMMMGPKVIPSHPYTGRDEDESDVGSKIESEKAYEYEIEEALPEDEIYHEDQDEDIDIDNVVKDDNVDMDADVDLNVDMDGQIPDEVEPDSEEIIDVIPITEVDLSDEDKPFLESDQIEDENSNNLQRSSKGENEKNN